MEQTSPSSAATANALAAGVEALIARLHGLQALLREERSVIAAGEVARIDDCNRRKQAELDALGGELATVLQGVAAAGESGDIEGLGRLLEQRASDDRHWRALRQRLSRALQESQDLNQINGYLAYTGQREASALLGVLLKDRGGAGEELTYDPSGRTGGISPPRGGTTRKA